SLDRSPINERRRHTQLSSRVSIRHAGRRYMTASSVAAMVCTRFLRGQNECGESDDESPLREVTATGVRPDYRTTAFRRQHLQLRSQCFLANVPFCDIADDCHDPGDSVVGSFDQLDRKLNGDLLSVAAERRNGKQLARAIPCHACFHSCFPSSPMPGPKSLGNDEIHGAAEHVRGTETKDPFCRTVPIPHCS